MQNILKIGLLVTFIVFGAIAFSSASKPASAAATATAESLSSAPRDLYVRNCARCHGADGKGQTELGQTMDAPDLTTNKTSFQRNVQIITDGAGAMPSFKRKLKKADVTALANYVRKL